MTALTTLHNVSPRAWRVWQRNLDVYRATWIVNLLPPLLEPVLYVLAFGLGMGRLIGTIDYLGHPLPYLRFMVPGVISVTIMFWSFFETTYSSFVRMYYQRTFDAIMATPLLVEDVIVGEWLWGASKAVMAGTLVLVMMSLFGQVAMPLGLLVIPLTVLGGLLFASVGLVCTAVTPNIDTFNVPMFVVVFPMFLFSGTFFPIDILPGWAMAVALALPLTHVSMLVRGATTGIVPDYWGWSLVYLGGATVIAAVTALLLMKRRLVR
jgi:lipooligosaccharide transport system permease protein